MNCNNTVSAEQIADRIFELSEIGRELSAKEHEELYILVDKFNRRDANAR
jgi:uncharacterized protein YktB (UPF0637 family)